jgi:hypothetical protein
MIRDRNPLFSGDAFADRVKQIRQTIQDEVKAQNPRYRRSSFAPVKDRDTILAEQTIAIPEVTSKEARVRDDEIEYAIRFEGANGTFFRFKPLHQPVADRPVGRIMSNVVCLYTSNSGDASSIKAELARQYENFHAWYSTLRNEVEEFNNSLPEYIDQIFRDAEEREKQDKALEDELNG